MVFYLSILTFILTISVLAQSKLPRSLLYWVSIIVLTIAAGTCENFAVDNSTYINIFETSAYGGYSGSIEPVWRFFNTVMYNIGFSHIIFFLTSAFLVVFFYFNGIRKLSPDFWFSVILFIVCQFYFNSMNIIRQYVAMAILFSALPVLIREGRWSVLRYCLYIVLASQFHLSALFCIPFVFFCRIRFKNWLLILLMLSTIVFGPVLMRFSIGTVLAALKPEAYSGYVTGEMMMIDSSIGFIKVLIMNAIGVLIVLFSGKIKEYNPRYFVLVNMMVAGIVLYNVFSEFMALMRVYLYFYPVVLILIPLVLRAFTPGSRMVIKLLLILGYSALALSAMPDGYYFNFELFR